MPRKPGETPGLEWKRVGARRVPRWRARRQAAKLGYAPATVQFDEAADLATLIRLCRDEQQKMEAWLAGETDRSRPIFDGTLGSLFDLYEADPESPYQDLKHSTRQAYNDDLKILRRTVGERRISRLDGRDFRRWYNNLKKPAKPGGPERLRRAHGVMTMLRIVIGYGRGAGIDHCGSLKDILAEMRFKTAPARESVITYLQASAFIARAHEIGRPEMALGQALQFEGTLRQIDIIGEWVPDPERKTGRRWASGLIWQDLLPDFVLQKPTSKNRQLSAIDFREYPLALAELDLVPIECRIGPVIIDGRTGEPFKPRAYTRLWREIATMAGIPAMVWNRDSRAGGVTEGSDAGATRDQLRRHASHASGATTERYSRASVQSSREVARLRVAHRAKKLG